jgi:hypothetical protein
VAHAAVNQFRDALCVDQKVSVGADRMGKTLSIGTTRYRIRSRTIRHQSVRASRARADRPFGLVVFLVDESRAGHPGMTVCMPFSKWRCPKWMASSFDVGRWRTRPWRSCAWPSCRVEVGPTEADARKLGLTLSSESRSSRQSYCVPSRITAAENQAETRPLRVARTALSRVVRNQAPLVARAWPHCDEPSRLTRAPAFARFLPRSAVP